jgi:hypothetical protein
MPVLSVTSGTGLTVMQNVDAGLRQLATGENADAELIFTAFRHSGITNTSSKDVQDVTLPFLHQQCERTGCILVHCLQCGHAGSLYPFSNLYSVFMPECRTKQFSPVPE